MASNRRHQSAAVRFGPALKAFLLCLLIGGSGVGYVWQKTQIYQLDQQIRRREIYLVAVTDRNEKLARQLATMNGPGWLEERAKRLGLGPPLLTQVWSIPEPEAPRAPAVRPYSGQDDTIAQWP